MRNRSDCLGIFGPTNWFELSFDGVPGATYWVFRSTDMKTWYQIGDATETASGEFIFQDFTASNAPSRLYRVQMR